MDDGRLLQVNVSAGGVPKLPVPHARVTRFGVEGDRQRGATVHGGPHRAVSILGIEAIRRVAAEGHPIGPGTTGENLTVSGFDVSTLPVGTRLAIGDEVVLELAWPANPCRTIRHSFAELRFGRLSAVAHPADSRMYARVVSEGTVRPDDPIRVIPPVGDDAERLVIADRLDRAENESTLAGWRAAADAGIGISIVDDGDIVIGATPTVPGPSFNVGLGFAHLPNLLERARSTTSRPTRVTGWVWTDAPPWPDAVLDSTAAYVAMDLDVARLRAPSRGPRRPRARAAGDRDVGRDHRRGSGARPGRGRCVRADGGWTRRRAPSPSVRGGARRGPGGRRQPAHPPPRRMAPRRHGPSEPSWPGHPAGDDRGSAGARRAARVRPRRCRGQRRWLVGPQPGAGRRAGRRDPRPLSACRPAERPAARRQRACGACRRTEGSSGRARRLSAARRSIPRSRSTDQPMPYCRRISGRRVVSETRCAASHASRGIQGAG